MLASFFLLILFLGGQIDVVTYRRGGKGEYNKPVDPSF